MAKEHNIPLEKPPYPVSMSIYEPGRKEQEIASLVRCPDSSGKIVAVKDYMKPWRDDNGIKHVGVEECLLSKDILKR